VIRAFNDDKPYNRFILEQIAGDELNPDDPEMQIAVGFLRMGPWEHTGMSVAAVTRQLFLDDVTNSVGETFLGIGMSCFKCHDHKFDPLPTRDYYRMQAIFASTEFAEPRTPFLPEENRADFARIDRIIGARIKDQDWFKSVRGDGATKGRINKKRKDYLRRAAERTAPKSFSVTSRGKQRIHILIGGSLQSPSEPVEPGLISAMNYGDGAEQFDVPGSQSGRRLALARWIASRENTLTARVIVNRIWQMHFGRGIVATPNNFGKMGARPTHPELLDYLAAWFMDQGWSIKKLHRLIMTSDAYQRSGQHPQMEAVQTADPKNELLAYFPPRRLSAG